MLVHQMVSHCQINLEKGLSIDFLSDIYLHICATKRINLQEAVPRLFQLRPLIYCWTWTFCDLKQLLLFLFKCSQLESIFSNSCLVRTQELGRYLRVRPETIPNRHLD